MTERKPNAIMRGIVDLLSSPGIVIYSATVDRGFYEKPDPKHPQMTEKVPSDILKVVVHYAPAKRKAPRTKTRKARK